MKLRKRPNKFGLKSEYKISLPKTLKHNSYIRFDIAGYNWIELKQNGDILIRGKRIKSDLRLVQEFEHFLATTRTLPYAQLDQDKTMKFSPLENEIAFKDLSGVELLRFKPDGTILINGKITEDLQKIRDAIKAFQNCCLVRLVQEQ